MKKSILLYLLFILMALPIASIAKKLTPYTDSTLMAKGVKVNVPPGFEIVKNPDRWGFKHSYYSSSGKPVYLTPTHYLHNRDTSILITIQISGSQEFGIGPYDRSSKIGRYGGDRNIIGMGSYLGDSRDSAIVRFDVQKLEDSNADYGALSIRDMGKDHPNVTLYYQLNKNIDKLLGKFSNNRMLSLHKRYQHLVVITYFFKDTSEGLADSVIEQTKNIVMFEDRPKFKLPNIDLSMDAHYFRISKKLKRDSLQTVWNKGVIYQDQFEFWAEDCAFAIGDIVLSVRFISNETWPRKRGVSHFRTPQKDSLDRLAWVRGNTFYKKLLVLSKRNFSPLSLERLKPLNADEGFSFDFEYPVDDAYRKQYTQCKVMLVHKTNVGSCILRYYYKPQDRCKVDVAIESTWGEIGFQNNQFFKKLGNDFYPF